MQSPKTILNNYKRNPSGLQWVSDLYMYGFITWNEMCMWRAVFLARTLQVMAPGKVGN